MSHALQPAKRPDVAAIEAAAVAEGRHSHHWQTVCSGCGKWTSSIWFLIERRGLCGDCADKIGQGPKALAAKMNRPSLF